MKFLIICNLILKLIINPFLLSTKANRCNNLFFKLSINLYIYILIMFFKIICLFFIQRYNKITNIKALEMVLN